ncbi:MAG: J domain-containing protein, partial [bacterium]
YNLLGILETSSQSQIKDSYKNLLLQYKPESPDNKISTSKFKLVYEAYYILSDEFRRKKFDEFYKVKDFESEQFKLWRRNQLKKRHIGYGIDNNSIVDNFTLDIGGEFIIKGIAEVISSIFH